MVTAAIETHSLAKRYGRRGGIESVDLQVAEGQIYGFLGPNGAGKTTTIRVLLGFLRPGAGTARIFGRDCWRESPHIKRFVGYLPGDVRLYSWLTGSRAARMVGLIRRTDLRSAAHELAERFGLPMRQTVRTMSRGTRQKLGLVLALAHRPRLLILDEPTTALDPPMRRELAGILREHARAGNTIFFSSHTLGEVEQLCDRVGIIRAGRIIADETVESLRGRARRAVRLQFGGPEQAEQTAVPPFLRLLRRDGAAWNAELSGPVSQLLEWAVPQRLADLTIERPDLETLFHSYYK